MTGMEKGDILLYRFTRYSGQPRRRPGGRALPALWQAGGIHLPERGTGNFYLYLWLLALLFHEIARQRKK